MTAAGIGWIPPLEGNDHLIFALAVLQGKSESEVADRALEFLISEGKLGFEAALRQERAALAARYPVGLAPDAEHQRALHLAELYAIISVAMSKFERHRESILFGTLCAYQAGIHVGDTPQRSELLRRIKKSLARCSRFKGNEAFGSVLGGKTTKAKADTRRKYTLEYARRCADCGLPRREWARSIRLSTGFPQSTVHRFLRGLKSECDALERAMRKKHK